MMLASNFQRQPLRLGLAIGLATFLFIALLLVSVSSADTAVQSNREGQVTTLTNGNVITIGVAGALSGPGDWIGWPQANAVQLAISQTNAAGGVDLGGVTYTLQLAYQDSMCNAVGGADAAANLLSAGAVAVVGHTCSNASLAAQPLYAAAGVPLVTTSSGAPPLTEGGYTNTFRVNARDDAGATLMAAVFHDVQGLTDVAIVQWFGTEWMADAFETEFTGLGGTITSRRQVTTTADYTATLTAIKAENPAAIFQATVDAGEAGLLSQVAHNLGMTGVVIGWGFGGDLNAYAAAAGTAAEGDFAAMVGRPSAEMPGYPSFNAAYQSVSFANYGGEATEFGAFAYDAAQVIIAAIDSGDSAVPSAIRDRIAAAADFDGVVGSYQGFDAKGDVIPQWAWLELYQDGQWVRAQTTPPTTWYVHADGSDGDPGTADLPFATIQHAVDVAESGDLVLIHGGVYTENVTIADKTLTVRGGYATSGTLWLPSGPETTIVNGNGIGRTFLVHGNDSVLEQLTITGGRTTGGDCWGAGVWATNGDVTIRSSIVTGNEADSAGCGAGAGVSANWDWGPASLILEDTILTDNYARDHGGALAFDGVAVTLTNVLIVSNTAPAGHVLAINNSDVTIQNSTIADNNPQGAQAILLFDAPTSTLFVRNTTMWSNALNIQIEGSCSDCVTVTYSDIEGGWTGIGNINADPLFVEATNGDYSLRVTSPAVDAGSPTGAPAADIEGKPRDAFPDIGAYEWSGYRLFMPLIRRDE